MVFHRIGHDRTINLDHVAGTETSGTNDPSGQATSFYGTDGHRLAQHDHELGPVLQLDLLTAPLVPAAPGQIAVVLWMDSETDDAAAKRVMVQRYPVIAWRISQTRGAEPIIPGKLSNSETLLVELPDGKLLGPDNKTYSTMHAAKRAVLLRAGFEAPPE